MTFLNQWENLLTTMIKTLLQTDSDHVYTFLRIIAGIIVFSYGMQKLFGWSGAPGFGAPGIKASLAQITAKSIPKFRTVQSWNRRDAREFENGRARNSRDDLFTESNRLQNYLCAPDIRAISES